MVEAEKSALAEMGKMTAPIDHFTVFAILATVSPPPPEPDAPLWWWVILILIVALIAIFLFIRKYAFTSGNDTDKT